jgi:hypothetical protein
MDSMQALMECEFYMKQAYLIAFFKNLVELTFLHGYI